VENSGRLSRFRQVLSGANFAKLASTLRLELI